MSGIALSAAQSVLADLLVHYHAASAVAAVDPEAAITRRYLAHGVRRQLRICLVEAAAADPAALTIINALEAEVPGFKPESWGTAATKGQSLRPGVARSVC